jgi:hypothetical protein
MRDEAHDDYGSGGPYGNDPRGVATDVCPSCGKVDYVGRLNHVKNNPAGCVYLHKRYNDGMDILRDIGFVSGKALFER